MGCKQSKVANSTLNDKRPQKTLETSIEIEEVRIEEVVLKPNMINIASGETTTIEELIETQQMVGQDSSNIDPKISEYVHEALVIFLPGYHVDPFKDEHGNQLFVSPQLEVMSVLREQAISLSPDLAGTVLRHSIIATNYELHVAIDRMNSSKVKFLYQLTTNIGSFVTSPFHTGVGKPVPCGFVPIEGALKGKDPVTGIVEALGNLYSNNKPNDGFDGDNFEWKMCGSKQNFTISDMGEVYWADFDGADGEVKTTDLVGKQLRLLLRDL